ncbi:uncharacterized protein LOC117652172 [Thrips palmi]|uniref:Uncharacterized protein LOC117652172 n=1 Tax=Thrips palmi TaxID=161013 RepID=A0A6P9A990_THRPL|nr:uncharacterized protein LOC117652172 [Thrips palmi]
MPLHARSVLVTVVLAAVTQSVLTAPPDRFQQHRASEVAVEERPSALRGHDAPPEHLSSTLFPRRVHRPRRPRRGSAEGSAEPLDGDVDALRRRLFAHRRHHRDDEDLDFGGLRVDDFRREARGGAPVSMAEAEPEALLDYEDVDDGGDGDAVGVIVSAPRARCPPGERYYERQCRKVWR